MLQGSPDAAAGSFVVPIGFAAPAEQRSRCFVLSLMFDLVERAAEMFDLQVFSFNKQQRHGHAVFEDELFRKVTRGEALRLDFWFRTPDALTIQIDGNRIDYDSSAALDHDFPQNDRAAWINFFARFTRSADKSLPQR